MSVESDMFAFLTNPATATGALIATRLYPLTIPQESTMPAIAYARISNPVTRTQDGKKLHSPRYQFDCKDKTYDGAIALEDALIADAEYHGFGSVRQVHEAGAGPDQRDPDTGLFTRSVDLTLWR
jgi:hypothetical protein